MLAGTIDEKDSDGQHFPFYNPDAERCKHTQIQDLKRASGSAWLDGVACLARLPQGRKASMTPQKIPCSTNQSHAEPAAQAQRLLIALPAREALFRRPSSGLSCRPCRQSACAQARWCGTVNIHTVVIAHRLATKALQACMGLTTLRCNARDGHLAGLSSYAVACMPTDSRKEQLLLGEAASAESCVLLGLKIIPLSAPGHAHVPA